jgi:hypothetical protein
MSILGNLNLHG